MSILTVSSFQPQFLWQHGGTTATLRLKYSMGFTDSEAQAVLPGFYKTVPCGIADGVLTVSTFTLITTNDALVNPLALCSARFIDSNGAEREWLFQNFSIPQVLTPTCTIGDLFTYNQGQNLVLPPEFYLSRDETTALVISLLASFGFGPATELALGMVRLRIAAADPLDPEVYGTNDPEARDALSIQGTDFSALPPADLNVPRFSALNDEIQWAALTLRGVTPNTRTVSDTDSATEDDDLVFLDPTTTPDFNFTFMTASTRTTPFTVKNIATNANAVNLLPDGADTIDGVASPTPTVLAAGDSVTFYPRTSTAWESIA